MGIKMSSNFGKDFERHIQAELKKMQPTVNAALQDTVWEVNTRMKGQPADAVYDELVVRLGETFGSSGQFKINEAQLREVAGEISAGTLTR